MAKTVLRIGAGTGFQGDRLEPAVVLAEQGRLDYLVLECLAERTIALAQLERLKDPTAGYDPLLERRLTLLLPHLHRERVRLLTNMGAANPLAAGHKAIEVARRHGLSLRVAVVSGDDVLKVVEPSMPTIEAHGATLGHYGTLISANAYLGADAILPALSTGADVVITGRVADPSLFLAPMIHEFGWALDDWGRLARGTIVGHLLECAGQVTGGYFADPGRKDVPDLAHLGFPYCDVDADGNGVLGKVDGTGGAITLRTVKEQLLYEVTDPTGYRTPDVIADFTTVQLREVGPDRIEVRGGGGRECPPTLKTSVGYRAGYVGEGEISYAGVGARDRALLAAHIVRERLKDEVTDIRADLIGIDSAHRSDFGYPCDPYEVRLRVAARATTRETAERLGMEIEALGTNGPAGGGGFRKFVHERVGVVSTLLARERVKSWISLLETDRETQAA